MSSENVRGTPSLGLLAATLGFFFGFAAVALFGPTAKEFKDIMGLSPGLVGLLVAMPSLSGSLLRIPFSAWVDTTGGRKPFLVLLSISALGMLGLVFVILAYYPDDLTRSFYPIILVLGLLTGCGIAVFSVGISQVSYWFPRSRQGFALGTFAGAGNLAPGLFSLLIPIVLDSWGLGTAYVAWLALLVAGTLLYWRIGQNAPFFQLRSRGIDRAGAIEQARRLGQELFPSGGVRETLARSAANWKTWALVVLYFTTFGGFIALTAWLPTYWQELHDVSLRTAGALTAVFSVLASLIRIVGGSVSDRIGGERTAAGSLVVMLAGATVMTVSQTIWLSVVGEILMAAGMGVNNAAVFKLVPQEVPEAVGGAAGWVGGVGAFGGFAVPPLLGMFVRDEAVTGYARGFVVFAVLAIISLGVVYVLRRPHSSGAPAEHRA